MAVASRMDLGAFGVVLPMIDTRERYRAIVFGFDWSLLRQATADVLRRLGR